MTENLSDAEIDALEEEHAEIHPYKHQWPCGWQRALAELKQCEAEKARLHAQAWLLRARIQEMDEALREIAATLPRCVHDDGALQRIAQRVVGGRDIL